MQEAAAILGPQNRTQGRCDLHSHLLTMFRRLLLKTDGSFAALIKSAHKIPDQIPCRFEAIKLFRIQQAIRDVKPTKVWIYIKGFDAPACSLFNVMAMDLWI